jgi:hypothetical protein
MKKWIAIAGSWKTSDPKLEEDVRKEVRGLMGRGDGVVTGGALGVDYIATDEYLKKDPTASKLKIFLPCTVERYSAHYQKRASEGVVTSEQAEALIEQMHQVQLANPAAIVENKTNEVIDKTAYFNRITDIVATADELLAFQVNMSEGTQDTIDKAKKRGIPVKVYSYIVE